LNTFTRIRSRRTGCGCWWTGFGYGGPWAALDHWLKDIAPSDKLRIAYHADELDFDVFAAHYRAELEGNPAIEELRALAAKAETVALLYAARDETQNHAQLLRDFLVQSDDPSPHKD